MSESSSYENSGTHEDPAVKYGPGIWHMLAARGIRAKTAEQKKEFISLVNTSIVTFPCGNCRDHASKYLRDNPIEKNMDIKTTSGEDIGMFSWVWSFHNSVNARIGKKIMDWDTAYHMYSNPESLVCYEGCGEEGQNTSQSIPQPIKNVSFNSISRGVPGMVKITPRKR